MRASSLTTAGIATGILLASSLAAAQQVQPTTAAPVAAQAPPAAVAVAGTSDHDAVIGRVGTGYLGRRTVAMGAAGTVDDLAPAATLDAPVVGVRIWVNSLFGIDTGLGLLATGGSSQVQAPGAATVSDDHPATTGVILHGGFPFSLTADSHYSFQLIPEVNLGYAMQSLEDVAGNSEDHTGLHVDVGVRAGAEIHFGFMGIPRLSLQGSVGVRFDYDTTSTDTTPAVGGTTTVTSSHARLATTTYDNPWNIFLSNVAAIYYF